MFRLSSVLVVLVAARAALAGVCPNSNWVPSPSGGCFLPLNSLDFSYHTADDALEMCQQIDPTYLLPEIFSDDDLAVVLSINEHTTAWLGLRRQDGDSPFLWPSGGPVTYTAWHGGSPKDGTGNDCVVLKTNGEMYDFNCYIYAHPVICYTKQQ